jgi:hypothetical protein
MFPFADPDHTTRHVEVQAERAVVGQCLTSTHKSLESRIGLDRNPESGHHLRRAEANPDSLSLYVTTLQAADQPVQFLQ